MTMHKSCLLPSAVAGQDVRQPFVCVWQFQRRRASGPPHDQLLYDDWALFNLERPSSATPRIQAKVDACNMNFRSHDERLVRMCYMC